MANKNEQLLRELDEALSANDIEKAFSYFADDVVAHIGGQSKLGGDSCPHNGRDVFSAGAMTSLLNPAVNQADQARALIAIEHADSLWPVKSMRRKGEQADAHFLNVN